MDAMRYREGALGAVWLSMGLVNLSMLVSEASFGGPSPLPLAALVSLLSGSTLFLTGACRGHLRLPCPLACTTCTLAHAAVIACQRGESSTIHVHQPDNARFMSASSILACLAGAALHAIMCCMRRRSSGNRLLLIIPPIVWGNPAAAAWPRRVGDAAVQVDPAAVPGRLPGL